VAQQQTITVPTADSLLVKPNPYRVAVRPGINYTTQKEIILNLRDHGSLVTNGIVAGSLAPTSTGLYLETLLPSNIFEDTEWAVRMRETISIQTTVNVPAFPGEISIRPNEKRIALIIFPPQSGTLLLALNNSTSGAVLAMVAASSPINLVFRDHGKLVQSTFNASHIPGGVDLVYWETLLP